MTNTQTVLTIYEAFGRGDIASILGHLSEDVEWDAGAADIGVPWLKPRRGLAEVPAFFASLSAIEIRRFEPKTLLDRDDLVVAILAIEFAVRSTTRTVIEEDEVHIWRFNPQGKVASFRHKVDSHQHRLALEAA